LTEEKKELEFHPYNIFGPTMEQITKNFFGFKEGNSNEKR